jgi:hypothetical protein
MALLSGSSVLSFNDLYTSDATIVGGGYVGMKNEAPGGKIYRYALVGASALVKGNLLQASVQDTSYENMAIGTAGAVGDAFLQVTNGTATITAQQFAGGTIGTYTAGTVAIGDEYVITDVTGTLTTGGALKVWLDRPLRYAYTTSAKVNMKRSPWSGVVQFPVTTQTEMPVGVAVYEVAATQYGWVQSHGSTTALSDNSTFAVGSMLSPSLATAGAVGVNVAGTTHGTIGWARMAAASAHGISIFLMID